MARDFDLIAETRTDSGKGASRRLRRTDKIPAIVYGGGKPPRSVMFDRNQLMRKMESQAFFSSVLTVKIGDKSQPVVLKDVQTHPAKRMVLHLDFQRIVADEKIRMSVPVHFVNESRMRRAQISASSFSLLLRTCSTQLAALSSSVLS